MSESNGVVTDTLKVPDENSIRNGEATESFDEEQEDGMDESEDEDEK